MEGVCISTKWRSVTDTWTQGCWLLVEAASSVTDIRIPSLVDEVPTHSPSIPPLVRTLPSPRTGREVLEPRPLSNHR